MVKLIRVLQEIDGVIELDKRGEFDEGIIYNGMVVFKESRRGKGSLWGVVISFEFEVFFQEGEYFQELGGRVVFGRGGGWIEVVVFGRGLLICSFSREGVIEILLVFFFVFGFLLVKFIWKQVGEGVWGMRFLEVIFLEQDGEEQEIMWRLEQKF